MKTNLCKCNNCESVLIDQNPQVNAKQYELVGNELSMVRTGEGWVCPICMTDEYLTDTIGAICTSEKPVCKHREGNLCYYDYNNF